MVAKITTPNSLQRALNYNEQKVQKGVAVCHYAGNFLKDASELNFYEKKDRFTRVNELNSRAKTNTLHVSLNFDPSERLPPQKLVEIASLYMEKIGFGAQPYLVYEHCDAGHPHLHIVTTSIQENGRRMDTYNIGKNRSEKARKEIENAFGLLKAAGRKGATLREADIAAQKIRYGKTGTKQSITRVLHGVINRYRFASLHELNAVLKLYNLVADSGTEGSRIQRHGGLTYRVLDEAGNKVGVPIKASSIYFKPTLSYLATRFQKGAKEKFPFKQKLKTAIDFALAQKPANLSSLLQQLKNEKITVVVRANAEGFVYGLTFIDHRTACVFNGSDVGKEYSATAIQQRLTHAVSGRSLPHPNLLEKTQKRKETTEKTSGKKQGNEQPKTVERSPSPFRTSNKASGLLTELTQPEKEGEGFPFELRKKKKKRGRHL